MFAIALGLGPLETITIAISATVFIAAFTWVSIKGDLRELANELIDDNNPVSYTHLTLPTIYSV